MKKNLPYFLLQMIALGFFISCSSDDFKENSGIETRVFGRAYDHVNNIPVVNKKLIISEWNSVPQVSPGPNEDFIQFLDSTYTDEEGYYDFTFTTSGQGDVYYIDYEYEVDIWSYYKDRVEIENLGADNEVDYNFQYFYPVDLKITLQDDHILLPVTVRPRLGRSLSDSNEFTETNVTYTYRVLTSKVHSQEINFTRRTSEGTFQRATFILPPANTTELTEFEIFVSEEDYVDI